MWLSSSGASASGPFSVANISPRSFQQKLHEKTKREERALTVKELRQKEMLRETGQTSLGAVTLGEEVTDYGDDNRSAYEIIREWHEPPNEEVLSLTATHSLSNDITGKPYLFPTAIWKYFRMRTDPT